MEVEDVAEVFHEYFKYCGRLLEQCLILLKARNHLADLHIGV